MAARGLRGVYVCEGSSDLPIGTHIERIAADRGFELRVAAPDLSLLPTPVGRDVASQVTAALALVDDASLVFVHRDADREDPEVRRSQVRQAAIRTGVSMVTVPVVPVRMTEAWLLADETAIRFVAGNPGGRQPLGLPAVHRLEDHADPKSLLSVALRTASGLSGRRLRNFSDDFGHHRRQLLERLDPEGNIQKLPSWQRFVVDVQSALDNFGPA